MLLAAVNVFAQTPTFTSVSPSSAAVNTLMTINGTNLANVTSIELRTINGSPGGFGSSIVIYPLTIASNKVTFLLPDVDFFWNLLYGSSGANAYLTPSVSIFLIINGVSINTNLSYIPIPGAPEITGSACGGCTLRWTDYPYVTGKYLFQGTQSKIYFGQIPNQVYCSAGFNGYGLQRNGQYYSTGNSVCQLSGVSVIIDNAISGGVTPVFNNGPILDITAYPLITSGISSSSCPNSILTVGNPLSGGIDNYTITNWYGQIGNSNYATIFANNTDTINISSAGTYHAVSSNLGCGIMSNFFTVDSTSIVVSGITATATADGPTTFCSGNYVFLSATNVTGATYQWKKNGVNITSSGTSRTYKATATGSYTCVVTNACGSTTTNAIQVTTKTNASATVSATGVTSFCAGDSVTLNCTNLGSNYSIQWYRTNISMENATAYTQVVKQPGTYKVVTKNINTGCSRISGSSVTIAVNCRMANPDAIAVSDENEEESKSIDDSQPKTIRVFPNPNSGSFTFEYQTTEEGTGDLQILNVMGQSIYNTSVSVTGGLFQQQIDLGDSFQKGIYVVRFTLNGEQHDRKLVLQ